MIEIAKKIDCCGCEACKSICPKKCITMKADTEGFGYPFVNKRECIDCHLCEKICPILNKMERNKVINAVAFQHSNKEIRLESASGGAFSAIAEYVLERNGVVYGAIFSKTWEIEHTRIESTKNLYKMRGSKYVQSKIGNTYCQCKKDLQENRIVCFSGTPCQIEGLLNYLGDKFENLITIDLVCHGVPSPKVWSIYLADVEKKENATIAGYSFRSKKTGYHDFGTEILLSNGKSIYTHDKGVEKDFMHLAFFNELCSRPSCHDCAFKTLERRSDFTLFDLWHMSDFNAKYEDDKGTSAVFIHSLKGYNIIRELAQKHTVVEIDYQKAMELDGNNIEFSMIPNKRREEFFLDLDNLSIDELKVKYFSNRRVVNQSVVIKKMLKKIGIFNSTKKFVYTISKYRSRGRFK